MSLTVGGCDLIRETGFSLVGLLLAAGLLSLVTLGVGALWTQAAKSQMGVGQTASFIEATALASQVLNTQSGCATSGLVDLNISNPVAITSATPVPVSLKLPSGKALLSPGTTSVPGWNITSLAVTDMTDVGPAATGVPNQRTEFTTISLQATRTGANPGAQVVNKKFYTNLIYDVTAKKTIGCDIQPSLAALCASISGTFDAATKKCSKIDPSYQVSRWEMGQCNGFINTRGTWKHSPQTGNDVTLLNSACNRWCQFKGGGKSDPPPTFIQPACGTTNSYQSYSSGFETEFNSAGVVCSCVP